MLRPTMLALFSCALAGIGGCGGGGGDGGDTPKGRPPPMLTLSPNPAVAQAEIGIEGSFEVIATFREEAINQLDHVEVRR